MAGFFQQIEQWSDQIPPVDQWDPDYCGEIDGKIARDGQWWLQGTPLTRGKLVRLYSTVLKREAEHYYLVTPVEKWKIHVEDLPFVIVELHIDAPSSDAQTVHCRTNVGDWVTLDQEHPLHASPIPDADDQTPVPAIRVRGDLWARFNRSTYIELAEYLTSIDDAGQAHLRSAGATFMWQGS